MAISITKRKVPTSWRKMGGAFSRDYPSGHNRRGSVAREDRRRRLSPPCSSIQGCSSHLLGGWCGLSHGPHTGRSFRGRPLYLQSLGRRH
jgi:hypothetical protein